MKTVLKKIIEVIAGRLAAGVIGKYNPVVVGITGSVGKTSSKDAIYSVISKKYLTLKSHGNLNSELGLPLAIAGFREAKTSPGFWIRAILRLLALLYGNKGIGEILVLEMGVDKPGDMDKLIRIAQPDIGIVTSVGVSHLGKFGTAARIVAEKSKLVTSLTHDQQAIVCGDDIRLASLRKKIKAHLLTYGLGVNNMMRATNINVLLGDLKSGRGHEWGTTFKLNYQDKIIPVRLKHALGVQQVYAALAAAAVGVSIGMNLLEISEALGEYVPPKGRINLIEGVKGIAIIDDTYNASPVSASAALQVLARAHARRKIAVLADMLELGHYEKKGHQEIGKEAVSAADIILTYGPAARIIAETALETAVKQNQRKSVRHFDDQERLIEALKEIIREGDMVLVKGSQGMRMEHVVKAIMRYPESAPNLLVRQSQEWLRK